MAGAAKMYATGTIIKKNQHQGKRKWKGNNDNINKKVLQEGTVKLMLVCSDSSAYVISNILDTSTGVATC
jgi:hypothetical protein